ncbi:hypothetical protein BH10BAC3_BH10BAC3_19120 [soil metagenome]
MKRADQHPVTVPSQHPKNFSPELIVPDESGVVKPSEKEEAEHAQTPTMGALPVDNMGSLKSGNEWHSTAGDEGRNSEEREQENKNIREEEGTIIATGSGPDPEHAEDDI